MIQRNVVVLTLFLLVFYLGSCNRRKQNLKNLITNGKFKYWLITPIKHKDGAKRFYYADIKGNWILFVRGFDGSFERYNAGDIEFDEHWHLINDSLVYIQRSIFIISKLTSNNFNYNALGYYTEMTAAPDSMIPKEFLKFQK